MIFNQRVPGLIKDTFAFVDNNLGGSPRYLRELCEALMPLKKIWGCALTFNVLRDPELVRLMGRAGCRYVYTGLESLNPESITAMNKDQNKLSEVREVMQRAFASGIVLSFGLLVGADGDTNEYFERLPEYLHDLGDHCPTFLGIVCPYPETPFFAQVAAEGRLLPGVTSRDLDGYTLCHRPTRLHPSEAIEHFQRLSRALGSLRNVGRHVWNRLMASDLPRYKASVLMSAPEVISLRGPLVNRSRSYIAGRDPIEAWDEARMRELGLEPQRLDASSCRADPRGLARIRSRKAGRSAAVA